MKMEVYDCDSLDLFWNLISPIGDIFNNPYARFLYRGQSDSTWSLSPLVYRKDVVEKYKLGMLSVLADHPGQTVFEYGLLSSFIHHCDLRGLPIPNDSMEFREYFSFQNIMRMNAEENRTWPQDRVLPLMALAQHHGVPTRLLDWSSNAMIASYFAAAGVVKQKRPEKKEDIAAPKENLAVFGFTVNPQWNDSSYRHVHVPGSTSPNLAAQGGSFVLVSNSGRRGETFTFGVKLEDNLIGSDRLIKLTLPIQFAGDLLLRCHQFGVSAASVFPGYDGVAKAVMERSLAESFREILR